MNTKDHIAKAMLNGEAVVYAVRSTEIVDELLRIHDLTPVCTAALGRTISAAAMMASDFKDEENSLSVIIKGDGPMGGLIVCADGQLNLKGYVYNNGVELPLNENGKLPVGAAIGKGTLTVVEDKGLKEPYSGSIELVTGEIAEDFAEYFMVSQQQPSAVALGVLTDGLSVLSSSGIIVQPLPDCSDETITEIENRIGELQRINTIINGGKSPYEAIEHIFEGLDIKKLEEREIRFKCGCSEERIERVILSLGRDEIEDMIKDGEAEVKCSFCNTAYHFNTEALKRLLTEI